MFLEQRMAALDGISALLFAMALPWQMLLTTDYHKSLNII